MSLKRVFRGRTKTWTGTVKVNGVARNLATDKLFFTVKETFAKTDGEALFQHTITSGITLTNTAGGVFSYGVYPADTENCPTSRKVYQYDLSIVYASGEKHTLDSGSLEVVPDVTNSTS